MPNRLADEASPYLQQHADNPVNWFPWGPEAFEKARKENKPVFLSIGYATCHWCHVMAHESFEDPDIAQLLNEAFINIKVDREDRPDIDSMYMTVCQMITGQGGWPLNIVMTPDKEPFYAATYIPKDTRQKRMGMRQLIPGIKGMWEHEPDKITKAFEKIKEGFQRSQQFEAGKFPGTEATDYAAEQFAQRFDEKHGGFGNTPKFPSPHNLMFLLRQWKATGEERFLEMVTATLTKMRLGGIWDHIGYGFHRYSTDREWLLPHFEKMLYDQALMMMAYTEAWQATQNPLFKQTVFEIVEYVRRDLTHPEGGFYSAEDADSEGEEGKFYVWSNEEVARHLDDEDTDRLLRLFNFEEEANFREEATGELTGTNIPHLSEELSMEDADWFNSIREQLFQEREQRIHPLLDDKILTDWNALMIAALAKAGFVFGENSFVQAAKQAAGFIHQNLREEKKLLHRFRDGESRIEAMADDYAFLIWAYIELYQATAEVRYLKEAVHWTETFNEQFWDDENSGFYLSIKDEDQVFGRQKQIYDGAIPSSNSAAMLNMIRLSRLTGNISYDEYADRIGKTFSNELIRSGSSITHALQAILYLNNKPEEIIITGTQSQIEKILPVLRNEFHPFVIFHLISTNNNEKLSEVAAYTSSQKPVDNDLTLYKCREFTCDKPVSGFEDIKSILVN